MSLNELCKNLTNLSKDDIAILEHYDSIIQSIADLNVSNIFVDCLLKNKTDFAVVVSEAKPRDVSSYNYVNWVGKIIKRKDEPGVFETLIKGKPTYNILGIATLKELGNVKEKIQIYSSTVPIKNPENKIIGCLIMEKNMFEDVEKKYRFDSFSESSEKFSEILFDVTTKDGVFTNIMDEGFIILNYDGEITYSNPKANDLFLKLNNYESINNISQTLFYEKVDFKKIAKDSYSRIYEFRCNNMELQLKTIPVRNSNSFKGAIGVIKDITDIKEKEKEIILKSAMLQEMHHRVKNNLQTVASLLRLQLRRIDSIEAKKVINESINRIMSIAVIHEILSLNVDEKINLTSLVESILIVNNKNSFYSSNNIEWAVSGEIFLLKCDTAITLALVINELVQNALEHAFINRDKGMLSIHILSSEEGYLKIIFKDNGVGFDEKSLAQKGLGLQIIKMLIKEKLRGTIEFKNDNGSCVMISFKE